MLLLEAKSLPTNLWGMLADFYWGEIVTVTVNRSVIRLESAWGVKQASAGGGDYM